MTDGVTIDRRTLWIAGIAAVAGAAVIVVWSIAEAGNTDLSVPEAILLGLVEGLTEYLPVSSTGHLTVTQELLGLTETEASEAAADSYAIAIQAGAIVAVLGLYRQRIIDSIRAVLGIGDQDRTAGRNLAAAIVAGFVPAAVIALALNDIIRDRLFGIGPVVIAWLVGGILLLFWRTPEGGRPLEGITWRDGLLIGFAQSVALWPGVSRSLVTIVGSLAVGMSMAAAVEFSFLLGLVTLGAATVYETLQSGDIIVEEFGLLAPLVGFVAAFISAAGAVVWMVGYLQRHSLALFGWYRIGLAVVVGGLFLAGAIG